PHNEINWVRSIFVPYGRLRRGTEIRISGRPDASKWCWTARSILHSCCFGPMTTSETIMAVRLVTANDLEEQLKRIRLLASAETEGVFGPRSVIWRIDREAAIFLGAGRALLLQLAHPWVAAAISEHSRTFADPIGRFHLTFEMVFSLV